MSIRRSIRIAAGLAAGVLSACAPPLKDPWGLAVLRGEIPDARPVPHTLQADLGVRAEASGALPFTARLYAEPARRYRLDAFGFLTPVAASWLWRDEAWTLVRHDTREVVNGTGTSVTLEGATPLVLPDVHAVFGFLWGNPLPGFTGAALASDSGIVAWTHEGTAWRGRFDLKTGLCREASSAGLTLRYARHVLRGGLVVPGEIQVFLGTGRILTLEVRDRVAEPVWKKDPFALSIPAGYDTVRLHR